MLGCLLIWAGFATAQGDQKTTLDRQFKSAVALYDAGRFPEAATQLEALLPQAPDVYEVQELLGLGLRFAVPER